MIVNWRVTGATEAYYATDVLGIDDRRGTSILSC